MKQIALFTLTTLILFACSSNETSDNQEENLRSESVQTDTIGQLGHEQETSELDDPMEEVQNDASIASIEGTWILLKEMEGRKVIWEECPYGRSSISFSEDAITWSGGGDQWYHDIIAITRIDVDHLELTHKDPGHEVEQKTLVSLSSGDFIVLNKGTNREEHYVFEESAGMVTVIEEECDY